MKARKRRPPKVVRDQFFRPNVHAVHGRIAVDPNCLQCGAHVLEHAQDNHVNWHLKLTKLIEGKRDKK